MIGLVVFLDMIQHTAKGLVKEEKCDGKWNKRVLCGLEESGS